MKVRFYIEKRKGDNGDLLTKERPIFMTVAFHGKRVMISTEKNVDLQWWNHEKQRVRDEHPNALVLNMWLDDFEKCADAVWKVLDMLPGQVGVDEFKREFKRQKPKFSGGFFDVFFLFMEEGSSRWTAATYQKLRSFFELLKSFEQESYKRISFASVDKKFLQEFIVYQKGLGYSSVTIGKSINLLVWYLNWATKSGYNIYTDYKRFYKMLEREDYVKKLILYLEWEELMCLFELPLTNTKEERVRDLFCFMCFSGINYSELERLKKEDVEKDRVLIRGGARKPRFVPLNKYSSAVLEKYSNRYYKDNKAMPTVSMVTMNKYLVELGRKAQFHRLVSEEEFSKVEEDRRIVGEREVPIFMKMRAGIATGTFIANAIKIGIPAEHIATFTGVKKDIRVRILKQELSKREMSKFDKI